jgi:hypothetical protein
MNMLALLRLRRSGATAAHRLYRTSWRRLVKVDDAARAMYAGMAILILCSVSTGTLLNTARRTHRDR